MKTRQTDGRMEQWLDWWSDNLMNGRMNRPEDRLEDRQIDWRKDRWMDGQKDRNTDWPSDRYTDGLNKKRLKPDRLADGQINEQMDRKTDWLTDHQNEWLHLILWPSKHSPGDQNHHPMCFNLKVQNKKGFSHNGGKHTLTKFSQQQTANELGTDQGLYASTC